MAKCSECGFLTLRNKYSNELVEVDEDFRATGRVPTNLLYQDYYNYPICFTTAQNLISEVEQTRRQRGTDGLTDQESIFLETITRDRNCETNGNVYGFVPYLCGYVPKELREMLDREFMLKMEEERRERDRKYQEGREDADEKRQDARDDKQNNWLEKQEKRQSRQEWFRYLFLAAVTVIAALIATKII